MPNWIILREAKPEEAKVLSNLALRSKAYWGYSDEFMEACKAELTITSEKIHSRVFYFVVAETAHQVVGFYALERLSPSEFELEALFIEPIYIGSGIGRALITHAQNYIADCGGRKLIIQSDPNAEQFYQAVGAKIIASRESTSISGRILQVFSIEVN